VQAGVATAALTRNSTAALATSNDDENFYRGKILTAAFSANMLPKLTAVRSVANPR
jgi:hypothetical protein